MPYPVDSLDPGDNVTNLRVTTTEDDPTDEFEVPCGATFGGMGPALGIFCTKPAGHDDMEHEDESFTIERMVPEPSKTTYRVKWEIVDVVTPAIPAARGEAVADDR